MPPIKIVTKNKSPKELVDYHLAKLMLALDHARIDIAIETVIDPATRKSERKVTLVPCRGTPEFDAALNSKTIVGVPIIPENCDILALEQAIDGVNSGCFVRHEDAGWLFWATDHYYYREYPVFDHMTPPAWATQAVYFSK